MPKHQLPKKFDVSRVVMFTLDQQIDRRILLEADSLEEDGWQVTILAVSSAGQGNYDDRRVIRVGSVEGARRPRESLARKIFHCLKSCLPAKGLDWIRAAGWQLMHGKPEHFFQRLFADTIPRFSADIYVAHDLPMLPVASAAAACHGGKIVYDSHELFSEQGFCYIERKMWESLERRFIDQADAIITVNASIAAELTQRYDLAEVVVVHNAERIHGDMAIQEKLFHKYFNLPEDDHILLFQGGLSPGRNLENLVRATAFLQTKNVHLIILGNGEQAESLNALAKQLGVDFRVHFHPAVPQDKLLAYTASADAGIIPYQATCLNNYYCTPNKLFEFIAAGLPVIATDLPELRRIIVEHGIGIVGNTASALEIALLVDQMFSDNAKLKRCRSSALSCRSRINWQNESRQLLQVYRNL